MNFLLIIAAVILLFIAALFLGLFLLAWLSMSPEEMEIQRALNHRV